MKYKRRIFSTYLFVVVVTGVVVFLGFTSASRFSWNSRQLAKSTPDQIVLHGSTMGTTYSVRYRPAAGCPTQLEIQRLIDNELDCVNLQMSTYQNDSELCRFNDSQSTDWISVSAETAHIVDLAQQIAIASNGAYDVTVEPLVNLWGFGPQGRKEDVPSADEVNAARKIVGYRNLDVRLEPPALKKALPELRVDLSSIAKGHGSDRVSELLKAHGIEHSFVEIGGEIVTRGSRAENQAWQIGIEMPLDFERHIQTVIGLSGAAVATSGNYRNFFLRNGQRYSHTIDPSTGRPVTHQLASASVVAENCALADAIATCMMVLGPSEGLRLAEAKNWSVLLMHWDGNAMTATYSKRFSNCFPEVCDQFGVLGVN